VHTYCKTDATADVGPVRRGFPNRVVASRPIYRGCSGFDAFGQPIALHGLRETLAAFAHGDSHRQRLALLYPVQALKLYRVDAKGQRHLLHVLFQPEEGLGCAIAAKGAGHGFIGVDDIAVEAGRGEPVGAEGAKAGDHLHCETVGSVSASVGHDPNFHSDQFSVRVDAAAETQPLRVTGARGAKLQLTRVFEFDRSAGGDGQVGAQVLDQHLLFAAESAADSWFDNSNASNRQAKQRGNHTAHVEGHLSTRANDEAVVFIPIGDDDMGFDAGLLHLMHTVFAFKDKGGGGQGVIHVVVVHLQLHGDVADGVVNHLGVVFVMNHRRAGLRRIIGRKDGGQFLVFNADSFQCLLHEFGRFGCDSRHAVADVPDLRIEADLVVGGRLGITLTATGIDHARQVGVGLYGVDAGDCQRFRGIDRADAGMGNRAGEKAGI